MNKTESTQKITLPFVSPLQIFHDLEDCVTTTPLKVTKRLNRLRVVCKCLGIDPEMYISRLKLAEERSMSITKEALEEFLSREIDDDISQVVFADRDLDDTAKKVIEAELTSRLNKDLTLYRITCNLSHRLINRISRHSILGPLYKKKQIIFVHKGGIAQRLVLLSAFPQHKDEIEKYFGLGGDNDTNIIVDPRLGDSYDAVRKILIDHVKAFMLECVGVFGLGAVSTFASKMKSINVAGLTIPVEACKRNHFTIEKKGEMNVMDINILKREVFVSHNDSLEFDDEIGRKCHFTLLRYKKAFQVGKRVLGAELLDISIPHRDETKAFDNWHHYHSGQWLTTLDI